MKCKQVLAGHMFVEEYDLSSALTQDKSRFVDAEEFSSLTHPIREYVGLLRRPFPRIAGGSTRGPANSWSRIRGSVWRDRAPVCAGFSQCWEADAPICVGLSGRYRDSCTTSLGQDISQPSHHFSSQPDLWSRGARSRFVRRGGEE